MGILLPDIGRSVFGFRIVDRFEKFILFAPGQHLEGMAVGLRRHPLDGLETKTIGLAVRGHLGKAISGSPAFMQALIDAGNDGMRRDGIRSSCGRRCATTASIRLASSGVKN